MGKGERKILIHKRRKKEKKNAERKKIKKIKTKISSQPDYANVKDFPDEGARLVSAMDSEGAAIFFYRL